MHGVILLLAQNIAIFHTMKLIHLHILRTFILSLLLTILASVSLFLAVDFSERLDDLVAASVSFKDAIMYFVCKIPSIIKEVMIPASVVATLITYGILLRRREIIAFHALGIPPRRYNIILIWAGVLLSLSYVVFNDYIERPMKLKTSTFWKERVKKSFDAQAMAKQTRKGEIWYATKNAIYHIRYYDPRTNVFYRVSIYFLDDEFRLQRRIEAKQMIWEGNKWIAREATILDLNGNNAGLKRFPSLSLDTKETPVDFSTFRMSPEELSIDTIFHIVSVMRKEGVNPRSYLFELHIRFANATLIAVSIFLTLGIISRCSVTLLQSQFKVGIQALLGFGLLFGSFQLGTALASSGTAPLIPGIWSSHLIATVIAFKIQN